ncbi:hypothetical protein ACFQRL_00650 [Microbacterium fluvii]|uniref:Flagellar protein FlgN n=1 Tax=Microbacterium fluvii TaxID=415215 RepID=A0ABW2H8N9_9MICO|nr:hypothetical protein [Microbacterium fluvii]MCU4671095.1 hypothetical protein [Microbacterium fluvii]
MDIMLDLERLRTTQAGLKASIAEFESAGKINDDLEEAVGRPDDRGELRGKVGDFESSWDGKRGKLTENLQGILDQLTSIVDGWTEWDTSTASDLDSGCSTSTTTARRVG